MTKQMNLWSKSKYRNNGGYWCKRRRQILDQKCCSQCQYHPSRLELNTARILYSKLEADQIIAHPKLEVKPATSIFPRVDWAIDFQVNCPSGDSIYFETKGAVTDAFELKLKFIEYVYPDVFRRLLIIGSKDLELFKGANQVSIQKFEKNFWSYIQLMCSEQKGREKCQA